MKQIRTIFIALVLWTAALIYGSSVFGVSHGGDIVYTKPVKSVVFSHKIHVEDKGLACDKCHPKLFEPKALNAQGKSDFKMDAFYKGKYCGACHDGKTAFASNTQCARCHGGVKELKAKEDKPQNVKKQVFGPKEAMSMGKGKFAVSFKHEPHTKSLGCSACHSSLFEMKKGRNKISFADHSTNKYCYRCHNGQMAFSYDDCNKCHAKISLPASINFGKGDTAVKFSHDNHKAMAKCSDCHNKVFQMKKGSSKITFADHSANKFCYSCHNGQKASSADDCAKCHAKKTPMPQPLNYKPSGAGPVIFSHDFHANMFKCAECHPKLFVTKKGASKMNMGDIYQGKFCGACHNGKAASEATQCDKCHK
ncbi:MAG: cytochrome C [Nitrospirae bacterium]|nr:cytochrome C [Nitrospirota bacterium]